MPAAAWAELLASGLRVSFGCGRSVLTGLYGWSTGHWPLLRKRSRPSKGPRGEWDPPLRFCMSRDPPPSSGLSAEHSPSSAPAFGLRSSRRRLPGPCAHPTPRTLRSQVPPSRAGLRSRLSPLDRLLSPPFLVPLCPLGPMAAPELVSGGFRRPMCAGVAVSTVPLAMI